jgi:hypothetical protein
MLCRGLPGVKEGLKYLDFFPSSVYVELVLDWEDVISTDSPDC